MSNKLPKKVFIKREQDGEESFLSASEDVESHVTMGETVRIGEYVLNQEYEYRGEAVKQTEVG